MIKNFFVVSFFALVLSGCASTSSRPQAHGPGQMTYRELMVMDYDQLYDMVIKHTKAAHKVIRESETNPEWEVGAKQELAHAMRIILSRPDSDNMVAKLIPEVRREMALFGNYNDLLDTLANEGIKAFDSEMKMSVEMQTTYTFYLENLLGELQPMIKEDERARAIVERVRDAKIKVPYEVMAERKLQGMFLTESPSEVAQRILEKAGFKKKKK